LTYNKGKQKRPMAIKKAEAKAEAKEGVLAMADAYARRFV